jgi:hypothetical protein
MKNLLIVGLIFTITSCATYKMTDLIPSQKNDILLPALEPKIDINSFESAYSLGESSTSGTGYKSSLSNNSSIVVANSNTTMYKDKRIQDAITIFDRDVKDNITNPYGDRKGYILCRIADRNYVEGEGWAALSGFTLCIFNLFGMPFGYCQTSLDLEVEIYNKSDNLVGRYRSVGFNKTWIAIYYGYGIYSAPRISSINAFKSAMNDIKLQIGKDANRLLIELNK